jgi:uncharacterized protein YegL
MKKGLTEMVLILDKSGSMNVIRNDVVGGLNAFIEEQKKVPSEATFTLVEFDNDIQTIFDNIDIKRMKPFETEDYNPGGSTALLKAVSITIDKVGERLANTKEENRPEKVIVAIMTDGEENSSGSDYSKEKLGEKIKHQTEKYSWDFIFLGANFDVFSDGASYGIPVFNTYFYNDNFDLARNGFATYTSTVSNLRKEEVTNATIPEANITI